jgi:glutaredoxin
MNTVCVFTMKGCPYCESLKKRLSSMDILFEEYDVDDNPILWGQITNELKDDSLPTVFIREPDTPQGMVFMPDVNVFDQDDLIKKILDNLKK